MVSFTIAEPHPHVAANGYTHVGRGGAGNAFRVVAGAQTAEPSTTSRPADPTPRVYYSGRGGAGNVFRSAPPNRGTALQSFNDEVRRAELHDSVAVSHVGRGGAGNIYNSATPTPSEPRNSADTSSTRSGIWSRLSGTFSH